MGAVTIPKTGAEWRHRARIVGRDALGHLQRWAWVWAFVVVAAGLFAQLYTFGLNVTESLPHRFFLISKGEPVIRGQYVAFRWAGGGPYEAGRTFVKIVAGVPGDVVTRNGRDFFVNGKHVGTAKTHSRKGEPLEPGRVGVLGPGQYYVMGTHKDSLDSRYAMIGWIESKAFVGRAYALF